MAELNISPIFHVWARTKRGEALAGRFALNYKYIQSYKLCTAKM